MPVVRPSKVKMAPEHRTAHATIKETYLHSAAFGWCTVQSRRPGRIWELAESADEGEGFGARRGPQWERWSTCLAAAFRPPRAPLPDRDQLSRAAVGPVNVCRAGKPEGQLCCIRASQAHGQQWAPRAGANSLFKLLQRCYGTKPTNR
jgi:hypothetical protein